MKTYAWRDAASKQLASPHFESPVEAGRWRREQGNPMDGRFTLITVEGQSQRVVTHPDELFPALREFVPDEATL